MAIKIMVDCGHFSGYNKYTVIGSKTAEGDVVWSIGQYLIPLLKGYGFTVGNTKSSVNAYPGAPGDDNITQRGRMAAGYDLFISLHTNACESESVNRPVVIYPVSGKCKDLAAKIGAKLQSVGGWQNYQIFSKWNSAGNADYYGVIRGAAAVGVPGLIIEHTFHTNRAAANWLTVDANRKNLAEALAAVIAEYYGYKQTSGTASSTNATKPGTAGPDKTEEVYRVRKTWSDATSQIGAYKSLQSAKSVCDAHGGYYVFDGSGKAVYPSGDSDTVVPSHSSITRYRFKSSGAAPVYCDSALTQVIGHLNPGEEVYCIEAGSSLLLVWYALDNGNGYKAGYVQRSAGVMV